MAAVFLAGLALFGLIVVILAAAPLLRTAAARPARLETPGGRLAAAPPLAWVRHRLPRQLAWCRRRVDPRAPLGFGLTFTVSVGVLAVWAFGGISQYVVRKPWTGFSARTAGIYVPGLFLAGLRAW